MTTPSCDGNTKLGRATIWCHLSASHDGPHRHDEVMWYEGDADIESPTVEE